MRTMTIYDFANDPMDIDIDEDAIDCIYVDVESGDEIVTVHFKDGTEETYDAGEYSGRMFAFYDGDYIVKGKDIKKWLDYKPTMDPYPDGGTDSYIRMSMFSPYS